jgi:hypothetical protein
MMNLVDKYQIDYELNNCLCDKCICESYENESCNACSADVILSENLGLVVACNYFQKKVT